MSFAPIPSKPEWSELQQSMIDYWKEKKLFERSVSERSESKPYRFYDGPPFITGTPHYGSLLSSIIKDVVPRYQTMKGKRVERVWGWDCHGLPIEQKVQAKLGLESNKDIEANGIETFIKECYAYTNNTSAEWGWYIDQIGRWVDFENAYKTMDQNYMESVLWVFKQLYDKGLVYEGKRVSWYSWKLSTPISNFEIAMDDSYVEVQDTAVTVKFKIQDSRFEDVYLLAWTTTPWTVPAHMAIAVHEDVEYVMVSSGDEQYILAKNRVETVFKGVGEYEVIEEFKGSELVGLSYVPPFDYYVGKIDPEKNHRVYHADFVTDDSGTGIAHEAPEFGDVDFELAQAQGIHITEAVDNAGRYTSQIPDYEGVLFLDAIEPITMRMKEEGTLFKKESITHRVPECPRSKTLLMQKAQKSWFINIKSLKPKLFDQNEKINWFPQHVKHGRFYKSIETAPDWCISRSRYWGTPMPVWIGYDTDGNVADTKVFGSIQEIETASGMKVENLHRPYIDTITWEQDAITYRRIPEVFDCWVESGSMPWAQDHYPFENKSKMEASFPADFIAEYTGQIRAWFYVMHVLAVALENAPSFKNVVVTGVINGTDGRKMSKSYGNYPDPKKTILQYGSDAIRFYLMNSPVMRGEDMNFSEEGIQETLKKVILPLWNAYSFFSTYANIDGWQPDGSEVWFVRHGQTQNNVENRVNGGDNDITLNETGKQQARDLNKEFLEGGHSFDAVYCSTKARAKDTAQIALEGVPYGEIHYRDDIVEQYMGDLDSQKHEDLMKQFGCKTSAELRDVYRNNSKEPFDVFCARTIQGLENIRSESHGKKILIVAHGGTGRVMKHHFFGIDGHDTWKSPSMENAHIYRFPWTPKTHELDTWILSQLHKLIADVSANLEAYDLQKACDPFVKFFDNLNNWYIRRNRRRFWKGEMDDDKKAGYETLYEVLTTVCRLLAPVCPFISEYLYQKLTNKESVHLESYPVSYEPFIFPSINEKVDAVQKVISLGLAYRSKQAIRVRQPLPSVYVVSDLDPDQIEVIREELNVKQVIRLENISQYASVTYAPDARKIGQSDRKMMMKDILAKAKNGEARLDGIELVLDIDGSEVRLSEDEFEVRYIPKEGTDIKFEAGFGTVVGIDDRLTDDLICEGYARDMIRSIQDARKDAGFEITDRIVFGLVGDKDLVNSLEKYISMIEGEVLGHYDANMRVGDKAVMVEIGDLQIELFLIKK